MNPPNLSPRYQYLIFIGVVLIAFVLGASFISTEQAETIVLPQENQSTSPTAEREFRHGTPKHVPLKIKAKNVNSEKWEHDLEIEVTNTSDKPIYYLSFMLHIQDFKAPDGNEFVFWLHYGRGELNDFRTPLESTDIPLMPNETCVLRIPESMATGWEKTRAKKNYPQPKKLGMVFQILNFGDGTGFADSSGSPMDIHKKVVINQKCLSPPSSVASSSGYSFSFLPAAFAPVNFFPTVNNSTAAPDCDCGDGCERLSPSQYTCTRVCDPEHSSFPSAVSDATCSDPLASCRKRVQYYVTCWYGETPLSCSIIET